MLESPGVHVVARSIALHFSIDARLHVILSRSALKTSRARRKSAAPELDRAQTPTTSRTMRGRFRTHALPCLYRHCSVRCVRARIESAIARARQRPSPRALLEGPCRPSGAPRLHDHVAHGRGLWDAGQGGKAALRVARDRFILLCGSWV